MGLRINEVRSRAAKLLADARNLDLSKNSRNACITEVRRLERESGLKLYV